MLVADTTEAAGFRWESVDLLGFQRPEGLDPSLRRIVVPEAARRNLKRVPTVSTQAL
jgi:hypothetical protein